MARKYYTEAQKKATIKYLNEKTDDVRIRTPRGTKARWKEAAESCGLSLTRFMIEAVTEKIERMEKEGEG